MISILPLAGCDWFGKRLFNILDPQAEVKLYYSMNESPDIGGDDRYNLLSDMTFDLIVYPGNTPGYQPTA